MGSCHWTNELVNVRAPVGVSVSHFKSGVKLIINARQTATYYTRPEMTHYSHCDCTITCHYNR